MHDSNAFQDEKVTEIYMKFGYEGVGLFYVILEKLASQEKPIKTSVLKSQLKIGKRLNKCWNFMEQIDIISSSNGETFSKQLLNFSEKYNIKKEKNRKRILEWRENQNNAKNVTRYEHVRNATQVKLIEVNIKKEKEEKETPPNFKTEFNKEELNNIINYFRPLILAGYGLSEINNYPMFVLLTNVMEIANNKNNNLTYFITNLYAQNQLYTKDEAVFRGKLTTYTGTRENAFEDGNYMKVNYIDLMIKKDVNYKTKNEKLIKTIKDISKSAVSA